MPEKMILVKVMLLMLVACNPSEELPTSAILATETHPPTAIASQPPAVNASPTERINQTTSGTIMADETWRGEIHLTGDIWLANGVTLTIAPGTTVYLAWLSGDQECCGEGFDDDDEYARNDPTRFDDWDMSVIVIDGRNGFIQAIGTAEEPIVFTPEGAGTSPGQWDGIYIEQGTLQYAQLLYGGHTVIQILGQSPDQIEIAYNEVRHFLWAGIDAHASNVWIHHNIIEGGGHQGIGVHNDEVLVEHNIITHCQNGVNLHNQSNTIVRNNLIIDCANGIAVNGRNNRIINNTIVNIEGPGAGWYFRDDLIYSAFDPAGGVIGSTEGPETILNNIIYGPMGFAIGYDEGKPSNGADVQYNLYWGTNEAFIGLGQTIISSNNFNFDPLFADPENGDFSLLPESLAIDAGAPEILDMDGSRSDLGAFGGPGGGW